MMESATFLARALEEGRRYGDDSYVFLRELAQNARDARATRIRVVTQVEGGRERILVDDDGAGMSLAHAQAYLFRLYASSKEGDRSTAGHFGVGFWSVLRWQPDSILIESRPVGPRGRASRDPDAGWGVALGTDLTEVSAVPCGLSEPGTRVVLERPADSAGDLEARVREGLRRYCRYLRRSGPGVERLPVWLNGERIDEEMSLDGPFVLRFHSRAAQGVVGLGPEPRVELYARGLLVTTVSFLEELEPDGAAPTGAQTVDGLSPVILINSDDLDVVLSRRAPMQSRALRRLVRLGQKRVRRLVAHVIDRACPRPWTLRLRDALENGVRRAGGAGMITVVGLWLAVLLAVVLLLAAPRLPWTGASEAGQRAPVASPGSARVGSGLGASAAPTTVVPNAARTIGSSSVATTVVPSAARTVGSSSVATTVVPSAARTVGSSPSSSEPPATGSRPYQNVAAYQGAILDAPGGSHQPWGLSHDGPDGLLFKALTLDRFNLQRGWVRAAPGPRRAYAPTVRCGHQRCVTVQLEVRDAPLPLLLPLPTGYRLDPASLRRDGGRFDAGLFSNQHGEALIAPPGAAQLSGRITYRARVRREALGAGSLNAALGTANVPLPPDLAAEVRRFSVLRRPARARAVAGVIRDRIAYDVAPATVQAFAERPGTWLTRVLAVGAGDCDVKNGVNVFVLRHLGVPARLAVGIPTRGGHALAGLHAWTEYHAAGRWRVVDATGSSVTPTVVAGIGPRPLVRRGARPDPHRGPTSGDTSSAAPRLVTASTVTPRRKVSQNDQNGAADIRKVGEGFIPSRERALVLRAGMKPAPTEDPNEAGTTAFRDTLRTRHPSPVTRPRHPPPPPAAAAPVPAAPVPATATATAPPSRLGPDPRFPPSSLGNLVQRARDLPVWLHLTGLLLLLALLAGWAWRRFHVRESIEADGDPADASRAREQRALVKILRDALTQPAAWRTVAGLWHRRVLPTLRGRPLSVAEAIERAREGNLWLSRNRSPLAAAAAARGTPVLDAGHPIFGELIRALGRGVDLDELDRLAPSAEPEAHSQQLIAGANRVLEGCGLDLRCRTSPGLRDAATRDVDLSGLRLPRGSKWPRRFVAVNPRSSAVARRAALASADPTLGVFVWLDWLLDRSELLADHANPVRRRAAEAVIEARGDAHG